MSSAPPITATDQPRGSRSVRPWVTAAAFAVPACVLPSASWRAWFLLDSATGSNPCSPGNAGEGIYIASLSLVSLSLAALTIGLVRPWGERYPRWLPVVGGRPVPARRATAVAMTGATIIGALTLYFLVRLAIGIDGKPSATGCSSPGWEVLVFYLPLVAWAPLLFVVARDYYRRRTAPC
jgi:hypothetical protein